MKHQEGVNPVKNISIMNNNSTTDGSSSAPLPPWEDLPRDVTVNILRRLHTDEILNNAERVCTTWRNVCGNPSLYRVFDMKCSDGLQAHEHAGNVLRRAVDRSRGGLIDVNIRCFGTDDLLQYVSKRLSNLKILSLQSCYGLYDISPRGLTTAVKNLPHLEELHLTFMPSIRAIDIETIGFSCPMLKSFTFFNLNIDLCFARRSCNGDALSIAKTMPNLVCLCLFGNLLSNKGLRAILDGCPKLESLDLRECFRIDLECDLGIRCSEKIKELRCPLDGLDYPFHDPRLEIVYGSDDDGDE